MFNWIKTIFSSVGKDIIDSVGETIDELHTSTEEKMKIKASLERDITEKLIGAEIAAAEARNREQISLTERLKIDMSSDSWLSKNVRPLVVITLTTSVILLALLSIFINLTENQLAALNVWVPFFTTITVTVYGFYFGSRGIEKVSKLRVNRRD